MKILLLNAINFRGDYSNKDVLIISDEYNDDLIQAINVHAKRVVCWSSPKSPKFSDMVIDMLCCVPAKRFFGTPLSTLSTGIMGWRNRVGNHTGIEYIHKFNIKDLPAFYGNLPGWGKTDIPMETMTKFNGKSYWLRSKFAELARWF